MSATGEHSEPLVELPAALEHEGRRVLAIPVGMSRSDFALSKLAGVRSSPGWIVRGGALEPWRSEGFFRHEGKLYLYGPYLPGRFLEEALAAGAASQGSSASPPDPADPGVRALRVLRDLIAALRTLEATGHPLEELQTDGVCFLEDGGVLFLPPELLRQLRGLRPEAHRLACYQSINHPELRGRPEQVSFALAALLHRLLLGSYPFAGATEEELRDRIRHQKLSPLAFAARGLREPVARALLRGLQRAEGPAPSVADWAALLEDTEGFYRPRGTQEQGEITAQARREQARAMQGYRRRVFWQRHWKIVLITVASCAVVGGLGAGFLRNLLAPRLTRGLAPRQVVERFYGAFNSLDHALMEDCVVDGAGREAIREVINIFVLSRVRLGYEGKSPLAAADQWLAAGRPELESGQSVYGVSGLVIQEERGEPQPVFLAAYTKWFPAPEGQAAAGGPRFESQDIRERLYLRLDRRDWVIFRIERL